MTEMTVTKEAAKQAVRDLLSIYGRLTFARIAACFDEIGYPYRGNMAFAYQKNKKLIYWGGWNAEAFSILQELEEEGVLHREGSSAAEYLVDGIAFPLPAVSCEEDLASGKSLWIPVAFEPGRQPWTL